MREHLRGCLWLLGLTLVCCSVFYPLTLWGISRLPPFRDRAQGSLLLDKDGKVIGSRLIAQPFSADEYFQPRPSAASFNAMASGASNWGANNYLLRDRVARALGPIVKYQGTPPNGKAVQQDVAEWFKTKPKLAAAWAEAHPAVALAWVNADDKHKAVVTAWQKTHPEAVTAWKKENPDKGEPKPGDLAVAFFQNNGAAFRDPWPKIDDASWSLEAVFFDLWRQEHPDAALETVPADMVMASGSGLDPHITLDNARYQLQNRVAAAQADKIVLAHADSALKAKAASPTDAQGQKILAETRRAMEAKMGGDLDKKIREVIENLLETSKEVPFHGMVGVPLLNVLELNIALQQRMASIADRVK